MYSESAKKTDDLGVVLAETIPAAVAPLVREGLSLGRDALTGHTEVRVQQIALEQARVRARERLEEARLSARTARLEIQTSATVRLEAIEADREKNNQKHEDRKYGLETQRAFALGYLKHLERVDENELLKIDKGISSYQFGQSQSDAIAMSMLGLLAAPQAHRPVAATPQVPAIEMPQATASANSNHSVVPRK